MNDRDAILAIEGLNAWYGPIQALRAVTLEVGAGEAVMLLGRNGAGKSSLLKAIMGLELRRQGSVRFEGRDIAQWPTHQIARAGIGFVPEDRRIFTSLTVEENLDVGRKPPVQGEGWTKEDALRLFPALAAMRTRPGGRLSGGEQQMLTIARTLLGNPRLILLDEPSEGLAPIVLETIAAALGEMRRRGVAFLLSEQNLRFARLVASRAYVIESGSIRHRATRAELDADPRLVERYLAV